MSADDRRDDDPSARDDDPSARDDDPNAREGDGAPLGGDETTAEQLDADNPAEEDTLRTLDPDAPPA